MVDIEEGAVFEAEKAGAGDAVALEQDGGGVSIGVDVVCRGSVVDAVKVWQRAIGGGDGIGKDDINLAAELVKHFGEREGGTDGVAVGTGVGGEEEPGVSGESREESGNLEIRLGFGL